VSFLKTSPHWVLFLKKLDGSLQMQRDSSTRGVVNGLNAEQLDAVARAMEAKSVPYIIFGPPGTGKSRTLVHYVVQVLDSVQEASVLVSAPSNRAADVLAECLLECNVSPGRLLRVNAYQRTENTVSQKLMGCCQKLRTEDRFRFSTIHEAIGL